MRKKNTIFAKNDLFFVDRSTLFGRSHEKFLYVILISAFFLIRWPEPRGTLYFVLN